jgi:L-histidine Nalpha-methyltransferase
LGGDFDIHKFTHYPVYNPMSGACNSYLISNEKQTVTIVDTEVFHFEKYEPILMELSQKYSVTEIDALAKQTGFTPIKHFFDSRQWFLDTVWEKV